MQNLRKANIKAINFLMSPQTSRKDAGNDQTRKPRVLLEKLKSQIGKKL